MFSLILAAAWLVIGAGLVIWSQLHPEAPGLQIRGTSLSAGWLFLLLAAYNLVRWWAARAARAARNVQDEAARRRPFNRQTTLERNPVFDFDSARRDREEP